jgi:hypothetical protein
MLLLWIACCRFDAGFRRLVRMPLVVSVVRRLLCLETRCLRFRRRMGYSRMQSVARRRRSKSVERLERGFQQWVASVCVFIELGVWQSLNGLINSVLSGRIREDKWYCWLVKISCRAVFWYLKRRLVISLRFDYLLSYFLLSYHLSKSCADMAVT